MTFAGNYSQMHQTYWTKW